MAIAAMASRAIRRCWSAWFWWMGWPIAHHVFAGNRRDAMTVADVVHDLEQHFGIKLMVLVGDHGMVTSQNSDELRSGGHGYLVGRNRRRSGDIF